MQKTCFLLLILALFSTALCRTQEPDYEAQVHHDGLTLSTWLEAPGPTWDEAVLCCHIINLKTVTTGYDDVFFAPPFYVTLTDEHGAQILPGALDEMQGRFLTKTPIDIISSGYRDLEPGASVSSRIPLTKCFKTTNPAKATIKVAWKPSHLTRRDLNPKWTLSLVMPEQPIVPPRPPDTADKVGRVTASVSAVELQTWSARSYAKQNEVVIGYSIENRSAKPIICVWGSDPKYDLLVRLTAPDGKPIAAYPQDVSVFRRVSTQNLQPSNHFSRGINLAVYFPLKKAGEYRCTITKRVYERHPNTRKDDLWSSELGRAMDITSPEFRFRVEAIDPAWQSPLIQGQPPAFEGGAKAYFELNAEVQAKAAQVSAAPNRTAALASDLITKMTMTRSPWLVMLAVMLAAAGLLWLLLKPRK